MYIGTEHGTPRATFHHAPEKRSQDITQEGRRKFEEEKPEVIEISSGEDIVSSSSEEEDEKYKLQPGEIIFVDEKYKNGVYSAERKRKLKKKCKRISTGNSSTDNSGK